jgi:hypothetical protein
MKKILIILAAISGLLAAGTANSGTPINDASANRLTLAVFGDWPYSLKLLDAAPLLIDSINSDPHVRLVLHIGDIHAGSPGANNISLGASSSKIRWSTRRATTSGPIVTRPTKAPAAIP